MPAPADSIALPFIGDVVLRISRNNAVSTIISMLIEWRRYFSYWYSANPAALYSRRLTKAHELQRASYLFPGYTNCAHPHGRVRSLPDDDSRTTAERVICFRGTQTVPVAARNVPIDTTAKNRNANYLGYFQVPARASGH